MYHAQRRAALTPLTLCCSANDDGITPVHQAASEGHVQCLKLLIEIGARIDGRDCRGNTPLDLAKLWGHRKCARQVYTTNLILLSTQLAMNLSTHFRRRVS